MWVCYTIALIPVLVGGFLWLRSRRITFGEWMRGSVLGLVVAVGFHVYAIVDRGIDVRIVSGRVSQVTHWPKYTGGETEGFWGERWTATLDLGKEGREDFEITREVFDEIREQLGNPTLETRPPDVFDLSREEYRVHIGRNRSGAVVPGWVVRAGPRRLVGDDLFAYAEPPPGLRRYDYPYAMKAAAADALVERFSQSISGNSVRELQYLRYDWRRSGRLLGRAAEDLSIGVWDTLNAKLGSDLGVNLIAIGFNCDVSAARWQEARWRGGRENDVVICYGPVGANGLPDWTYSFGWSDNRIVHRNLESLFLTRPPGDAIVPEIEREVRAHYRPREWEEPGLFRIPAPTGAVEVLLIVTVVLQGVYWLKAFFNRDRRGAADAEERRDVREEQLEAAAKARWKHDSEHMKKGLDHLGKKPDVDRLREEMLRGREPRLATVALSRRRDPEAKAAVVLALTAKDGHARNWAAGWLNDHVPDPTAYEPARAAIPLLISRLGHLKPEVRREARRVLELVDPDWRDPDEARRFLHTLKLAIRAKQPGDAILDALGAWGILVYDDMVELAEDVTKTTGVHSLRVLGRTGDPRAVRLLLDRMDHEMELLVLAALDGFAHFGPGLRDVPEREEVYEKVHPHHRAARPDTRVNAALALGWLADERALPDLAPFLTDAASSMRNWAATSIGRFRTSAANAILLDRLHEADERDRTTIVTILGKSDDPGIVEPLIELLETVKNGGSALPSAIYDAICRFDRKDVRRTLEACADDFFCSGQDHAIRCLKDLREGRTTGAWTQ